jgi:hypothetical protein
LTPASQMNHANALVLTEKVCYIARINIIYQNPPTELSSLDCISANRKLPCSLCAKRAKVSITFENSPVPTPFPSQPPSMPGPAKRSKTQRLKKKTEYVHVDRILSEFGESIWEIESLKLENQFRPEESYFPSLLKNAILDKFFFFPDLDSLVLVLKSHTWPFSDTYSQKLYDIILSELILIREERKHARIISRLRRINKEDEDEDEDEDESDDADDEEAEVVPEEAVTAPMIPRPISPVSLNISDKPNKPRPKPKPRQPLQSAKEVMETFGPQRTKRQVVVNDENEPIAEENTSSLRRSKRICR